MGGWRTRLHHLWHYGLMVFLCLQVTWAVRPFVSFPLNLVSLVVILKLPPSQNIIKIEQNYNFIIKQKSKRQKTSNHHHHHHRVSHTGWIPHRCLKLYLLHKTTYARSCMSRGLVPSLYKSTNPKSLLHSLSIYKKLQFDCPTD